MSKPWYVKVLCLYCGDTIDLDVPTYENYQGQIRCQRCRALMKVRIENCGLKSCELVEEGQRT